MLKMIQKIQLKIKLKKYLISKKNGFILLMVMLLISSISLIVVSVFYRVYTSRRLSSTFLNMHEKERLLQNGITIIQNVLSGNNEKKENSKEDSNDQKEGKNNKNDKNDKKKLFQENLEIFWKNGYKWNTLEFNEKNDGAEGKVHYYLMAESGKIPLLNVIKAYFSMNEKSEDAANQKDKESNNQNLNNQKEQEEGQSNNNASKEDSNEAQDGKNDKKNDIFKDKHFILWQNFFKKYGENSTILKKFTGDDKKNNSDAFKKWIENYIKYSDKIYPPSIWFFFGNTLNKNLFYKNYFNKNKNEAFISDLITIYSDKFSPYFISPSFLQMISNEKFELTDALKSKFLEAIKESFKSENDFNNIEKFWNDFYQKILNINFPKEIFDELKKNNILDLNEYSSIYTCIINIESRVGNLTAIVVFEKITTSGKNNKEYLVKQIFFL